VVIPAFNQPGFLAEAIRSVLDQTYRDFEIVVVDDGSRPETRAAIEPFPPVLRYFYQANQGQSAARNRGAREARGELLAFLDHDDRWEKAYLAAAVDYLESHPEVGVVAQAVRTMKADGSQTPRIVRKRSEGPRYSTRSLLEGDVGTVVNPVVRRSVFLSSGGYDGSIHGPEDCDLWIRLSFLTEMHFLPEPNLLYRVHPSNASRAHLDNARNWLKILDKLERDHPDFVEEHRRLVNRYRSKQLVRFGRQCLGEAKDGSRRREAREALARAIVLDPVSFRGYLYAVLAAIPGAGPLFGWWRRFELAARERLRMTALWVRLGNVLGARTRRAAGGRDHGGKD
jgi:glycosyltransferase involved in cell wall biosynthesis